MRHRVRNYKRKYMMKKIILSTLLCLSVTPSVFAYQTDGIADDVCKAKGATPMLEFRPQDIDINSYSNAKGDIEYSLTLLQPNPVQNKLILSNTSNDIYTDLILKSIDQNRNIEICFSSKGDIVSLKTKSSEKQ